MWALRRAANPLRSNCVVLARTCCVNSYGTSGTSGHGEYHYEEVSNVTGSCISLGSISCGSTSMKSFLWSRHLSSRSGAKSNDGDDDLEDGFSDLEVPSESVKVGDGLKNGYDDDNMSPSEVDIYVESDDDSDGDSVNSLGMADVQENLSSGGRERSRTFRSPLFKTIMDAPRQSLTSALDKYVEEGQPLGRSDITLAILMLRKRRLYSIALQFVEWLEATKRIEMVERDYASHLDLIAKVQGLVKAEKFIEEVPSSFRGEVIYRTLLANCVAAVNVKKAEEVFNKIRDLGFTMTSFACNQLLLLYKRVDRKKVADVLLLMEKENVKPTVFSYWILIDIKGRAKDISGMEQILETMKATGVEPDIFVRSRVAKFYIFAGLNEKAEAALKEIEGDDIEKNRHVCKVILPLYADLGKADEVGRVWKICEAKPRLEECLAAIEAWGKLGKIENAEEIFENMSKQWKKLSSRYYNALLKVYANNKLLTKGKELAKRMSESGCRIGPLTWDAIVKLYVQSGEVEKAVSILQKASQQGQSRPLYNSYMTVMDIYSKRGDVHNAEKMFYRLKQVGYVGRIRLYQALLQAYINAKTPAYGFRERMKADNMFPNKAMAAQLAAVDAFRKSEISELLD